MSFRILRAAHLAHYKDAIDALYRRHPNFDALPYAARQEALFGEAACYSNGFSKAMAALGNEACEVVYDFESLQRAWARENGLPSPGGDWQARILLAQIAAFRPDVLYFQGASPQELAGVDLAARFPFLKVVAAYSGYPSPGAFQGLSRLDILFAGTPRIRDFYRAAGHNALLLYHGFDDSLLDSMPPAGDFLFDFLFAGSSGFGYGLGHRRRYWLLADLLQNTDIHAFLHEPPPREAPGPRLAGPLAACRRALSRRVPSMDARALAALAETLSRDGSPEASALFSRVLEHLRLRHRGGGKADPSRIPPLPLAELFPGRCRPPVFGMEMYHLMRQAKVVLNVHTDAADGEVGNMRLFEATGVGACLLTDSGSNLQDLFEDGAEVVAYSSPAECKEKLRFLLDREDVRLRIARAGQARTLRDHTLRRRAEFVHQEVSRLLARA